MTTPPKPPVGGVPRKKAGDGWIVNGKVVPTRLADFASWRVDPQRAARATDFNRRSAPPVCIVGHANSGTVLSLVEAAAPPSDGAERLGKYQRDSPRFAGWHFTVDRDETVLLHADLERELCWHAPPRNRDSIGFEFVQGPGGVLYRPQVDAAVIATVELCDLFGIPKRVPVYADGRPYDKPIRALQPVAEGGQSQPWPGVLTHRNLTVNRGKGDNGDSYTRALLGAGFQGVVFG